MVDSRATWKEVTGVAALLLVFIALQIALSRPHYLLGHRFRLDETFTYRLVTAPDAGQVLHALAEGMETHPPTYYFLLRGYAWLGGASETSLRLGSLLAVYLGLVGLYLLLREACGRLTAFVGVLAVWVHPLILEYAVVARSYAPLFAASVWFAWLVQRLRPSAGPVLPLLVGIAGVLLCTMHYFGIISLGLIVACDTFFQRERRLTWPQLLALAAGPLALLASVPLLQSQRAHLSVPTWVGSVSLEGFVDFFAALFLPGYVAGIVLICGFDFVFGPAREDPAEPAAERLPRLAGVTGLIGIVPVLVAYALLVHSVLVPRYALAALAAFGPAVALGTRRCGPLGAILLLAFLFLIGARTLRDQASDFYRKDLQSAELIEKLRTQTAEEPVFFEFTDVLAVVELYEPKLARRCYLIDVPLEDTEKMRGRRFVLDLARNSARVDGTPKLAAWSDIKSRRRILVLVGEQDSQEKVAHRYPGYRLTPLGQGLFELTAVATGS
ncbi:MAG: glycosyltransferase family 39 protein [Gemmataceae bacterium]